MYSFYSCGPKAVHNVRAGNPRLCLGYLELSNTLFPRKMLSFSKPPRRKAAKLLSCIVLDGKEAPGPGKGAGSFRLRCYCSALFRTVPHCSVKRGLITALGGPVPSNTDRAGPVLSVQSFGPGGPEGLLPAGSGSFRQDPALSRYRQDPAPFPILWRHGPKPAPPARPKRLPGRKARVL